MNSRSGVNEKNLVNYSTDLSSLNPLETKESLLSFPFDHIYACHSDTSEQRPTPQLDKEIEISTHCADEDKDLVSSSEEVCRLSKQLIDFEKQNKRLKELLIYHLDLIQQQNDLITKRDKIYQSLKQENDTLKTNLSRMTRNVGSNPRHRGNPQPRYQAPSTNVTSTAIKSEPAPAQLKFKTYDDLLLAETGMNSFIFPSELKSAKPLDQDGFDLGQTSDVSSYYSTEVTVGPVLDSSPKTDPPYTMIENKKSVMKKEIKTEPRSEPLYTVTSNSGNTVIQKVQRNRRRSSGIGSMRRNRPAPKAGVPDSKKEDDLSYEKIYSINKKSKFISTYGKNKTASLKRTSQFTGSLSDRLRLIDTTPTGEDPYQLGEADMREQSPIPKLMLQKSNHGRMKIRSDTLSGANATRRIYDAPATETSKQKLDRYNLSSTFTHTAHVKKEPKTLMVDDPDLDIVKTEPEIDWALYANKTGNETSLCDFSYGENSNNLATNFLPILDSAEIQDLLDDSPLDLDSLNTVEFDIPAPEKVTVEKAKKRGARTASSVGYDLGDDHLNTKPASGVTKRGRKRATSTTGLFKNVKLDVALKGSVHAAPKPKVAKVKPPAKGKKSPLPGMVTTDPYHTLMGDPDLSWYLGLDPDVKFDDIDPIDCRESTVEVPMWREMPYTSSFGIEDTEKMDDKIFEKRHQKLEAEERRQLRWHMRRLREQRHVERLKQRQRHTWCRGAASQHPEVFTIWPQPQRDVRAIEITDTLPVIAFGENLPAIPESDFMLPWVRMSKALKRAKRSKTLH